MARTKAEREKDGASKRKPSRAQTGGEHTRSSKPKEAAAVGHRSTFAPGPESWQHAFDQAQAEDNAYADEHASEAGPDPYDLQKAGTGHEEAVAESSDQDAQIVLPGEIKTDTGMKINTNPARRAMAGLREKGPKPDNDPTAKSDSPLSADKYYEGK